MKQFWIGMGILTGLLAVCFGAFCVLRAYSTRTLALLTQAQTACVQEDPEAALRYSQDARRSWEKSAGFIDTIMSHEETDDIHREFSDLLVYAEHGERKDFLSSCGRLLIMVEHLTEMERPLLRNVL